MPMPLSEHSVGNLNPYLNIRSYIENPRMTPEGAGEGDSPHPSPAL